MKNRLMKIVFAAIVAACVVFGQSWAFAEGVTVMNEGVTVTAAMSPKHQAAALGHWTRARIAAARALPLPVDRGRPVIDAAAAEQAVDMGPEGSSPAGPAEPGAAALSRIVYARDWAALEKNVAPTVEPEPEVCTDSPTGSTAVYTYYDVNVNSALWKVYPHKWSGKLTFTTSSGGASCSATAISGNNIVTAGHCVYDTASANKFYTNIVFTPAYRNGSAPYGSFPAQNCSVLTAYVNLSGSYSISTWARHDVAVCTLGKNSAGQTINGAVGYAGRMWNAANTQLVFNNGYPSKTYTNATISSYPGQFLRSCTAETFLLTTETLGGGCYWGPGISGGSWLVKYKPFKTTAQVNSVNSGLYIGEQNLYGARFNSNNIVVLCNARGC